MKKFIKNNIFGFLIGITLCSGIVYGTNVYESNTIEYSPTDASWGVGNVGQALNSLHSMVIELENIKSIGDATAAQILSGKTAVVKGSTITGTMTDRGAVTSTLNAGGSYTIPAGYHNGSGKVTVNTLASQTSATATAAQILNGQTAWVSGSKVTGTMTNNGAVTKSLAVGGSYTIPAGYHNGSGKVTNAVTNKGTLTLGSTNGTAVDITDGYYTHVNTTAVYNAGQSAVTPTILNAYTYNGTGTLSYTTTTSIKKGLLIVGITRVNASTNGTNPSEPTITAPTITLGSGTATLLRSDEYASISGDASIVATNTKEKLYCYLLQNVNQNTLIKVVYDGDSGTKQVTQIYKLT